MPLSQPRGHGGHGDPACRIRLVAQGQQSKAHTTQQAAHRRLDFWCLFPSQNQNGPKSLANGCLPGHFGHRGATSETASRCGQAPRGPEGVAAGNQSRFPVETFGALAFQNGMSACRQARAQPLGYGDRPRIRKNAVARCFQCPFREKKPFFLLEREQRPRPATNRRRTARPDPAKGRLTTAHGPKVAEYAAFLRKT